MWLHRDFLCDKWAFNNACRYDGGATTFMFAIWCPTLDAEQQIQKEHFPSPPSTHVLEVKQRLSGLTWDSPIAILIFFFPYNCIRF